MRALYHGLVLLDDDLLSISSKYMKNGPHRASLIQIGHAALRDKCKFKRFREESENISPFFTLLCTVRGEREADQAKDREADDQYITSQNFLQLHGLDCLARTQENAKKERGETLLAKKSVRELKRKLVQSVEVEIALVHLMPALLVTAFCAGTSTYEAFKSGDVALGVLAGMSIVSKTATCFSWLKGSTL
ncbi:hypothetical protein TrLO_g410 [Triparma laevis f. longispina]|uniref:Uncharacterized protein n=1 Tax=Triparma laevis f. longispina TaxID=1714387 RepID=A0A9W7FCU2_9STRA|nr:hypothetical protein TrLO_g410 [Triparma laevis f. longispina]